MTWRLEEDNRAGCRVIDPFMNQLQTGKHVAKLLGDESTNRRLEFALIG